MTARLSLTRKEQGAVEDRALSSPNRVPDWLLGRPEWNTANSGALVIGGDYRSLGTVRSLGRHKIPVWVLVDDHLLAGLSRYTQRRLPWPETDEAKQVEYLLQLSETHNLRGWALIPSSDETAATVSRYHRVLRDRFRLTLPPWEVLQWAYDKRLTYRLASMRGIPCPWTRIPGSRDEVELLNCRFPVILKPAVKPVLNALTVARAWRVENRESLLASYDEACRMVDPSAIMIQEFIPGSGEEQFSYAALSVGGRPLASLTARRVRQYPVEFGRFSTFVETVDNQEVEEWGRRFLSEVGFTGLIELEFKRDPSSRQLKLLDVNPRIWGWHTLGRRAGVDFSYLLWRLTQGDSFQEVTGRPGIRWVRMSTDLAAALSEIRHGRLSAGAYLRSLFGPIESAVFAVDDPLPGLLEVPLSAYQVLKRRWV